MNKGKKIIGVIAFLYLLSLCFFSWGLAAGNLKIFPWKYLASIYDEVYAYFTFQDGATKTVEDKIVLDHQEKRSKYDSSGFNLRDPDFQDDGYLLISRYSKEHAQVLVELFSIADEKVLHTWIPSQPEILERVKNPPDNLIKNLNTFVINHPLLLDDGSLVFNAKRGPLVKVDSCGSLVWAINRFFHHSIEMDDKGNFVTCCVLPGNGPARHPIRDDSFAVVSPDGKIISEYSVTEMLLNNGYDWLVYGIGQFETDRIHLNDAQPILENKGIAQVGDVALSIRNLSTVALVEPESGKIKWLKTGPWMNQHDINLLGDGHYSIFGNDVVRKILNGRKSNRFVNEGRSEIYIYDQANDRVTRPYASIMDRERIRTFSEGKLDILANGDAFIEEQNFARLLRISEDQVRWEYVNKISADTVGEIHWSRYIPKHQIDLQWLENLTCN